MSNPKCMRKKAINFKFIFWLALTFSRMSGHEAINYNDDSDDGSSEASATKAVQVVKNINIRKEDKHIKNNIADREYPIYYPKNQKDVSDYANYALVKRIVPHGYGVTSLEYDDKFKTLYKPLVRIHKRKGDAVAINNDNRYDLIYLLNDSHHNDDMNRGIDAALFKPFAIDNMDMKYMPTYKDVDTKYINTNKINKYDLGDRLLQLTNQIIPISKEKENDAYVSPKDLKFSDATKYHKFGKNMKRYINTKMKSIDLISKRRYQRTRNQSNIKTYASEPIKLQWFGTIGQLVSKHFQTKDQRKKKVKRAKSNNSKPDKKLVILIKDKYDENGHNEVKNIEYTRNLYDWFGPIGHLTGKQIRRKDILRKLIEQDKKRQYQYSDSHSTRHRSRLPKLVNTLIARQTAKDIINHSKYVKNKAERHLRHNNKDHTVVKKHDLAKWSNRIGDNNFLKHRNIGNNNSDLETKSNKYTLLNQISQLRAKNIEKGNMEKHLRMFEGKSGEDPDIDVKGSGFWSVLETTTMSPTSRLPSYPFWNYWTYEKTIHQDTCKGQTVLLGNICIGVPH